MDGEILKFSVIGNDFNEILYRITSWTNIFFIVRKKLIRNIEKFE